MSATPARLAQHQNEEARITKEIASPETSRLGHQPEDPLQTHSTHPVRGLPLGPCDKVEPSPDSRGRHCALVTDPLCLEVLLRCAESDPNHLTIETLNLSSTDTLKLHLVLDGGFAAELTAARN